MKTQQSHNPREWLTSFMDGCHEMALNHLRPHIQKMFENCDIALLEFSEKAQSSTSQIRFMEAGTIIKKYRKKVEAVFYQELQQGFTRFKRHCLQGAATGQSYINNRGSSEEQLTLISKEETDIEVAIQNMVASASLGSIHELTAIRQRLAVLNNGRKLQEQQIPAGPVALARGFHQASDELLLEHETKLIVYLLFDKFVLSKTRPLYDEYNGRLFKAGLLQNLKFEARKYPHAPPPRHTSGQQASPNADNNPPPAGYRATGSDKSLGDELFDNILELMSRRHQNVEHAPENPMPQAELVSAIHRLQQNSDNNHVLTRAAATSADSAASKQAIANMIATLTSEREQLFRGVDRRQLPTADARMIDLVGMMFEYMLNDDEIPNVAKAELSRLHTPYLKVAIIDKTFFTDNTHPAHELLNSLARASTRWVFEDNPDRGIFPCIRKIVTHICLDFNNDLDIFTEMLGMLHASLHDLRHKAVAIEERSRQAAVGREKLELARQCAADNIREVVRTHNIPAAIRQMIEDVWRDKLMFIYLREPDADQSDSWRLATQTLETILWCVEPRTTTEEQAQLRDQCTVVYNQIKQSLDTLSAYGSSDVASELALIREHTEAAINAVYHSPAPLGKGSGTAISARSDSVVSADADVSKSVRKEAHQAMETWHESPASVASGTGTAASAGVADHADGQAGNPGDEGDLTSEIAVKMAELSNMPFGTWFRIRTDAECAPVHAKLSWYSGISGNYMFVDSMGIKVAVLKQRELAGLLVSGHAEITGEQKRPLIRRALEAIRSMLGHEQTAHA